MRRTSFPFRICPSRGERCWLFRQPTRWLRPIWLEAVSRAPVQTHRPAKWERGRERRPEAERARRPAPGMALYLVVMRAVQVGAAPERPVQARPAREDAARDRGCWLGRVRAPALARPAAALEPARARAQAMDRAPPQLVLWPELSARTMAIFQPWC